jgi:hypothetical protein
MLNVIDTEACEDFFKVLTGSREIYSFLILLLVLIPEIITLVRNRAIFQKTGHYFFVC